MDNVYGAGVNGNPADTCQVTSAGYTNPAGVFVNQAAS